MVYAKQSVAVNSLRCGVGKQAAPALPPGAGGHANCTRVGAPWPQGPTPWWGHDGCGGSGPRCEAALLRADPNKTHGFVNRRRGDQYVPNRPCFVPIDGRRAPTCAGGPGINPYQTRLVLYCLLLPRDRTPRLPRGWPRSWARPPTRGGHTPVNRRQPRRRTLPAILTNCCACKGVSARAGS